MDYKRIIKSRATRFAILRALSFVPDSVMLRVQYRIKMGFWPDFKHPKRYTEKLQLYKMEYRNPVMHQCVDKYEVRKYVESKGLGHILTPLYGVYDHASEIDLDTLPDKFVAKTTDGGGGNNVIIVRDKSKLDEEKFRRDLDGWIRTKGGTTSGREWAYTGIKQSRIIIEKYLEDDPQIGGGI